MTREQLISWQAAYGLKQDLMSPESYLQHETPNKNCMVIREPRTAVFHLLLLLLLLCYHCAQEPPWGASIEESCFQVLLLERLFPETKSD